MNQLSLSNSPISDIQVIASSGPFQIELLKHVGENDYSQLILISKTLEVDYGKKQFLHMKQFKNTLIKKVLYHLLPDTVIKSLDIS